MNYQRFYRQKLDYVESAIKSEGCDNSLKPYYEAVRKEAIKELQEMQLKEFDK